MYALGRVTSPWTWFLCFSFCLTRASIWKEFCWNYYCFETSRKLTLVGTTHSVFPEFSISEVASANEHELINQSARVMSKSRQKMLEFCLTVRCCHEFRIPHLLLLLLLLFCRDAPQPGCHKLYRVQTLLAVKANLQHWRQWLERRNQ